MPPVRSLVGSPLVALAVCAWLAAEGSFAQDDSEAATRQYAAAAALQNREVYDLAIDEWTKFLEQHPKDPRVDRAYFYRGVCQYQQKNFAAAVPDFRRVLVDFPKLAQLESCYLHLGLSLYRLGQGGDAKSYEEAAEVLGVLTQRYPEGKSAPQALLYQGECLTALGKSAEAARLYQRFIDSYPKHELLPQALYALGIAQVQDNKPQEALGTFQKFVDQFAAHRLTGEVLLRQAELCQAHKKTDLAQKLLARAAAIEGFPLADLAMLRLGEITDEAGDQQQAAKTFAELLARFPNSKQAAAARVNLGRCQYQLGRYEDARQTLEPAAEGAPELTTVRAAHYLCQSLMKLNRPADAVALADRLKPKLAEVAQAVELDFDRAEALGQIPDRQAEALGAYRQIESAHPGSPIAARSAYLAVFSAARWPKENRQLGDLAGEYLKRYPGSAYEADVRALLAEHRLQAGDYETAAREYSELLAKFATDPKADLWRVRRGWALERSKKPAEAIQELSAAIPNIQQANTRAEAFYLVGLARLQLGLLDQALAALEQSRATSQAWPDADQAALALADAQSRKQNVDAARQTLSEFGQAFPQSQLVGRACLRLAECELARNDLAAAAGAYERVLDENVRTMNDDVPKALSGLAAVRLKQREPQKAIETASRLVDHYPPSPDWARARYVRAAASYELKDYKAARDDLTALAADRYGEPILGDVRYLLALCQLALETPTDAAGTLEQLLNETPGYAAADKAQYELAFAYIALKDNDKARQAFEQLGQQHPNSPLAAEALYQAGQLDYQAERFADAARLFEQAADKAGATELGEKATHRLAWAYERQTQLDKALVALAKQQSTWPAGQLASDGRFLAGEILFKQGKYDAAIEAYTQAGKPTNPDFRALALLHSAQAAAALKDFARAGEYAASAVKELPDSPYLPELLYEQAWAAQNVGQGEQARSLYEQAAAKTDREVAARARFMLGELAFEAKDHKEAVRQFFKVAYGYNYPVWQAAAQYEAGRCFEVLGKLDQARKSYQEIVDKFPTSDKAALAKERLTALAQAGAG